MNDEKALARLYTMSDWQEFKGFNPKKVLEELKPFEGDWKRYNPNKKGNNRWGLSVTSYDGGLSGIPDLTSLRDYENETGITLKNSDLNIPTPVWTESTELKRLLEPWKKWITRCHFLRIDKGGFFPDHFDVNKHDFSYDEIRLAAFVNINEYSFKWICDDKIIKGGNGSLWYFNANKRHCVFSTEDDSIVLIIMLHWDKDLFLYMLDNGYVG
jgi:hypothetical protein|tara:strand:+ start:171 stop:809 length:639 start_codon:yes stop_codon:yes gene_type:complete